MVTIWCDVSECDCNEDGYCRADIVEIDAMGECKYYDEVVSENEIID